MAQAASDKEMQREFYEGLEELKLDDKKVEEKQSPHPELTQTTVPHPEPCTTETNQDSRTAVVACASGSISGRGTRVLSRHVLAPSRLQRKWTLTDLLQNFGIFVQKKCSHIPNAPSATEVAMWVRCADRALHLNGWTINSFLLESHIVFSYMLVANALESFNVRTLVDVKELVLMCLYISYTYNANEISYPLRPFLVKSNAPAFWDKCLEISLNSSGMMLRLNRDNKYYADTLASLRCIPTFC